MFYSAEIIDPLEEKSWDEMVLSFNEYSFFHSQAWAQVLASTYKYTPHYFLLKHKKTPVLALPIFEISSVFRPTKAVSLPFTDHCEILKTDIVNINDLFKEITNFAQKERWKTIEFRGGTELLQQYKTVAQYNLHILELCPDENILKKKFRRGTRGRINKAIKNDVKTTINNSFESIKSFYDLNCNTRKHHGVPPQPFNFFKKIHKYVLNENKGIVILAKYEKVPIAGAIFFHFGETAMYKYGASNRKFLSLCPNNVIMWEAIKWYSQKGFKKFDMGRSEIDNQGLNSFKSGWGTTEKKISYYRYDINQKVFLDRRTVMPAYTNKVFRSMPMTALRFIGTLAYRYMG